MKKAGFSLIELLVVIAIISVLAAIAAPVFQGYSTRVKVTDLYNLAKSIVESTLTQYISTTKFPSTITIPSILNYEQGVITPAAGSGWQACTRGANGIDGMYLTVIFAPADIAMVTNPGNINGTYTLALAGFIDSTGTINWYCGGMATNDGYSLLSANRPAPCTYNNMSVAGACVVPTS